MSEKPKKNQKYESNWIEIQAHKKFIQILLGFPPIDLTVENYLEYLKKEKRKK